VLHVHAREAAAEIAARVKAAYSIGDAAPVAAPLLLGRLP
jgi:hypothetical protein